MAFAHPGRTGATCRPPGRSSAPQDAAGTAALRERIATGRTVMMVAIERGEPVAVGLHHPLDVDGSEVSEIVGAGDPAAAARARAGAGIASALAAHARETADLVFLTAGDDDVARVYERVGFAWLGAASPSPACPELSSPRR